MATKTVLSYIAVGGVSAVAGYLFARRRADSDADDELDQKLQELYRQRRDSNNEKGEGRSPLARSASKRKLQRLGTAVFDRYLSDEELLAEVAECVNEDLSPSDNAASLLHLMMSDTSISSLDRASLVYTMRALKLTEGSSTLPSALLESASKESLHKKSLKSFQNFRKNSLAMLRKAASTNSVGSASSNFRMADSPALTGEADKEIVFEWLRNEYSNYGRKSSFATSSGSAGSFKGRELTGPPSAGPTNSPFASPAFIRRPHCPTRIDGMGCYEPTKKELKAINEALEGVNEWDWDVFKLSHASNGHPIQVVGWHVLSQWGLIESFEIDEQKLRLWLAYIESQYVDTPYHNKIHASDVTQTVHAMLATGGLREYLTESQVLALLLTAIAHDVGHDGLNNKYHKNARSERAMTFNDQSIQENYHLRVIFESMRTHSQIDLFEGLDEDVITELRDMMIRMVLHTDMSTHFVALKEFNTIAEKNGSSVDLWKSNSHSDTLMSHVLHCCDLSGQAKKQSLAEIWSQRCIEEFFIQGDKEKDKGLPISPLCDRTTTPVAESQVGFIQYVVLPAYQALARVLPTADLHVVQLRQNSAYWESRKDESVFK